MNRPVIVLSGRWVRLITNQFWLFLTLLIAARWFIDQPASSNEGAPALASWLEAVFPPYALLAAIILAIELIIWKRRSWTEHALVIGACLITAIVVLTIYDNNRLGITILTMPLLVAVLTFRRAFIIYTALFSLTLAILLLTASQWETQMVSSIIIIAGLLIGTAITGLGVNARGIELMQSLEKMTKSEQELLIKNVIMDRLTKVDPLTDLYNHKTFHEYMEKLVGHHRSNPYPLHLAVMDIDNFKAVNDTYGHSVGDLALQMAASRILELLRSDDFAARYGGEEFVVLLTGCSEQEAYEQVERIREAIERTQMPEMNQTSITISIGLHHFQEGESKETAFKRADSGLYQAKRSGKNRTVIS